MELFAKLYSGLLVFVYHCFDRIVIHGYLSGLSRPEQVVYFFHEVLGMPVVDKEVLRQRTNDYQNWVEAYARNHNIPIQWAEKGVRKEDQVLPALHQMERANAYGVYFIFKSMEQGRTFRVTVPKYPTQDPNYRILAQQWSRFTFIFKRHFPIHKIFERSCEIGLWRLTANRISEIFGVRLNKRLRGKLATVIDQIEHGHHVFRAYWKNAFLKQYEKFSSVLRNELCSNNLCDFVSRKGSIISTTYAQDFTPSLTASLVSRLNASMSMWIFPCCSGLPYPSLSARSAIPESKFTTRESSGYWRSFCTAATQSVVGLPNRFTPPSSPPSSSLRRCTGSTNSATIFANSKAMAWRIARTTVTLTASQQKAFRWRSCSCSSTSASAALWPTAAFTTNPILHTAPIANWKPLTTKPITPSRKSLTYSPLRDVTSATVKVFLFTIFDLRIGSEQEFVRNRILGRFLKNHEFSLGRCHALGLQQQVMEILVAAAAA